MSLWKYFGLGQAGDPVPARQTKASAAETETVRKIVVNEPDGAIAIEYDATRMDQNGVAALLRRLGVPLAGAGTV